MEKRGVENLALFGGKPIFDVPKSTSSLYCPSEKSFFTYAESIFTTRRLTNNGPLLLRLEDRLAELHGSLYCVGFCSGFMALQIAMYLLALSGKKEVIMPSATYRRMVDIVLWAGLRPRFTDIDLFSAGMSPENIRPHICSDTALILGVHPIVHMSDMIGIETLSHEFGIPLLIDAVEAAYGTINGRSIGSFGDAEVFSMHASKFINGAEGGYLTTNNKDICDSVKKIRSFGFSGKDNLYTLGTNAKLNEVHAAFVLANIDELENQIDRNKLLFSIYDNGLDPYYYNLVRYNAEEKRTWKNIVVDVLDTIKISRDTILKILNAENILARPYYAPPLHKRFNDYVRGDANFTHTDYITNRRMILPSGSHVDKEDIEKILRLMNFICIHSAVICERVRDGQ